MHQIQSESHTQKQIAESFSLIQSQFMHTHIPLRFITKKTMRFTKHVNSGIGACCHMLTELKEAFKKYSIN